MINLYNQDCLESMKLMPDKAYDLAIVDPPYGIGVNHNMGRRSSDATSNYNKISWDNEPPKREYFMELERVSRNQIIWGANHFVDLIGKRSSCWLIWDKKFSNEVSFASCELAFTSFCSVVKRFEYSSARINGIHPTQKPVALYKWLLKNYARPGDRILDTHGGSMSIAIACHDMGYDLDLYEIDKDYFESGKRRLENHQKQGLLFNT